MNLFRKDQRSEADVNKFKDIAQAWLSSHALVSMTDQPKAVVVWVREDNKQLGL